MQAGRADEVMLRWSEVERMRAAGTFEFHSHTHTHTRWDRSEADPVARTRSSAADLAQSRVALQPRLGQATPHLCWPQGYFDTDYQDVARAAGFTHLYTTRHGTVNAATQAIDIPRIVVKDKPGKWLSGTAPHLFPPRPGTPVRRAQGSG